MFIGDFIGRGAQYWPEREAAVDVARGVAGRFTYRALDARARALAGWLQQEAGVGRGDRVGLLAHNGVEYLDALFACAKLGAIFVPYSWRLHARELGQLLRQTAPRALIHGTDFAETAAGLVREVPGMKPLPAPEIDALPAPGRPAAPEPRSEEDALCLLFTGGTTGLPRGARISYRMVAWNTLNVLVHEARNGDTTITHTPMFHTGGLLVYTLPLLIAGGRVVIVRRWSPAEFLQLVQRERPSFFFCVPTMYQQLLEEPAFRSTDFSSVRFMTSGGAPLPLPLIRSFQAVHPVPFKQGFGMTEFGPGLFSMGPEHAEAKAGSIGRPNAFVEAQLIREDGRPAGAGEVGELLLRGPCGFSGYFGEEPPRAAAGEPSGWFHTGDLARRDEDGFYFIAGRRKDMFISGGENVYPLEIEQALQEHPAVRQCAVIGWPDETWGEAGRAFVVLRPGMAATEAELLEHLRARLARFKVPKAIRFRQELPISAAGKVLKRELADSERAAGG